MDSISENFIYSQNSINTYKSCPTKFKYKYIENINWRNDDLESREYYDSLIIGSEFHLICERYFSNIPLGIDKSINKDYYNWLEKIKKLLPIEDSGNIYLPEYEVRLKIENNIISAKYDLVVIKGNNIEIWDWKTENKKVDYKNFENRIQTKVYMYIAKEVIPKIHNIDCNFENLSMKYYQPQHEDEPVTIRYNEDSHNFNKNIIKKYINFIKNNEYDIKNEQHCKYCEFNKLCNNQEVEYSILEEG